MPCTHTCLMSVIDLLSSLWINESFFLQVLNEQVMVRVGGGWDTLDHLLLKYDPCRMSKSTSISKGMVII